MSSQFSLLSLCLISILLSGCLFNNSDGGLEAPQSLAEARQKWETSQLDGYTVEVRQTCFCIVSRHYRLTVRDDTVSQFTNLENDEDLDIALYHFMTGDKWFAWQENVTQNDPQILDLKFDLRYSFPTKVNYDQSYQIADEKMQLKFSELKSL